MSRTCANPIRIKGARLGAARVRLRASANRAERTAAEFITTLRVLRTIFAVLVAGVASLGYAQQIGFPQPAPDLVIEVSADRMTTWVHGHYQVLHLTGNVSIVQGDLRSEANEALLFVESVENAGVTHGRPTPGKKAICYLKGQTVVEIDSRPKRQYQANAPINPDDEAATFRLVDETWLGRFYTTHRIRLNREPRKLDRLFPRPTIFNEAVEAVERGATGSVVAVQFQQPAQVVSPLTGKVETISVQTDEAAPNIPDLEIEGTAEPFTPAPRQPAPLSGAPGSRAGAGTTLPPPPEGAGNSRMNLLPRDSRTGLNIKYISNPQNPAEQVLVAVGGVKVVIDDPGLPAVGIPGQTGPSRSQQVVILADNVIAWESTMPGNPSRQEVYLEGNVVFAQGSRVIYADQMFYDATMQSGTIFNADMLTPAENYDGLVRLKADVIQQVDQNNLQAYGSAFTTSRIGVPRYWLQSEALAIQRQELAAFDEIGQPLFDRQTGLPKTESEYFAESRANSVYLGGQPVFFWPTLRTSLNDPGFYVNRIRIGNDRIFGTQLGVGVDMYQLLGWRKPGNVEWNGILDYLSDRGLGFGSEFRYQLNDGLFGLPGRANGFYKSWFIRDRGEDRLGRGRFSLTPEEDFRGRIVGRHQHEFREGFKLRAEVGYLSDRNFLEQFFEREWDQDKDYTTGVWLERNQGVQSWNLIADVQVNDFFTQTSWLPRVDHFVLGQQIGGLTWNAHSHLGYGRFRVGDAPLDPADLAPWDTLAWEATDADGIRAGTRHEISAPRQVGVVKVVPYAIGDITYWQEDITGNDLLRGYIQTGVRASASIWKVDPTIQSTLWNVNGLAHKVTFDTDVYYADASQDFDELPLYDPLDDDAQEAFRHRLAFNTFGILPGGDVDLRYDERTFALRSNLQRYVTSPSAEIADDQVAVRLGARQRWQTKRGLPGQERVIDWMTLDSQITYFPEAGRDNFGAEWGLFDYDFRWHLGDRFSLVSDGYFDFFGQGLRTASFGGVITRPEIGDVYLGYRMIEGPISSNIVTARMTYRMSDKWGVSGSTAFDLSDTGRLGQTLNLIYIGESFLWRFGVNADFNKDNVGFQFGFEPRIVRSKIFRPGNTGLGPASSRWLE